MIVHFSAHISKWELVCKFGVIFHIFIISCLCSRFHIRNQWFFYSVITFSYIKCFVHSYTVDVVFTLSYYIVFIVTIPHIWITDRSWWYAAVVEVTILKPWLSVVRINSCRQSISFTKPWYEVSFIPCHPHPITSSPATIGHIYTHCKSDMSEANHIPSWWMPKTRLQACP